MVVKKSSWETVLYSWLGTKNKQVRRLFLFCMHQQLFWLATFTSSIYNLYSMHSVLCPSPSWSSGPAEARLYSSDIMQSDRICDANSSTSHVRTSWVIQLPSTYCFLLESDYDQGALQYTSKKSLQHINIYILANVLAESMYGPQAIALICPRQKS